MVTSPACGIPAAPMEAAVAVKLQNNVNGVNSTTVNSCLTDTPLLRTRTITDKIQIPIYRGWTENDSQYYRLLTVFH